MGIELTDELLKQLGFKPSNCQQVHKWTDEYELTGIFISEFHYGIVVNGDAVWSFNGKPTLSRLNGLYYGMTGKQLIDNLWEI